MSGKWKLFTIVIGLVLVSGALLVMWTHRRPSSQPVSTGPSLNAAYITASPVDLAQIESVSKFRSCAGHDSSGHNFAGEAETDRSMKHYVKPAAAFYNDLTALYAPFDGTVDAVDGPQPELGPGQARGGQLDLATPMDPNVLFTFGHLTTVDGLDPGDTVQAGQLVGYAATAGGNGGNDFDLVLRAIDQPGLSDYDTFDSIFAHMTAAVLAQYAAVGVTKGAIIVPKATRDATPCLFDTVAAEPSERTGHQPAIQTSADNWVVLRHSGAGR